MRRATTGRCYPKLIDPNNTANEVWADTAYRSTATEKFLAGRLLRSQIDRQKPKSLPRRRPGANRCRAAPPAPMPANRRWVRRWVRRSEHVFARHKGPMGRFIRTIGWARATTKIGLAQIGLANLVYNLWTSGNRGPKAFCNR
jgi:transposase, IS5 family